MAPVGGKASRGGVRSEGCRLESLAASDPHVRKGWRLAGLRRSGTVGTPVARSVGHPKRIRSTHSGRGHAG